MQLPAQTLVIGGGISGLACAFRLREAGVRVLLLEQSARAGGLIGSARDRDFLFETGPQSFMLNDALRELVEATGLSKLVERADPRASRYVLVNGRLEKVPMAPPSLLNTSLLDLRTKWRLLTEPFRKSRPPEPDESISDFVRRKFGAQLLDRLVGPFVSGVYAGDPERLSLRSAFPSVYDWEKQYGSVLRGAMKSRPSGNKSRPTLCSFQGGNETLPRSLGEKLEDSLRCGVRVDALRRNKANGKSTFEARVSHDGHSESLTADSVVIATDTPTAARLTSSFSVQFPEVFGEIEYAPVSVVAGGYRRADIGAPLEGFGFLVPRKEKMKVLGTVWNSSLFPGRAPDGMAVLTSFAGGATDPDFCLFRSDQIQQVIHEEVAGVLRISSPPEVWQVHTYPRALPQYNLGHRKLISTLGELSAAVPGLFLTGNYFTGPSVGSCVERATLVAQAVRDYLAAAADSSS